MSSTRERDISTKPIDANPGDPVYVRRYDNVVVRGRVEAVWYSVSGWKARVISGSCILTVNLDQITRLRPS